MEETSWVPIPGYQGYFCNSKGQICSRKTKTLKLLAITSLDKQTIRISLNKTTVTRDVHYLVALTYHPKPSNCDYIAHIDGDSWNNRPENLMWVSEAVTYTSKLYSEQKMKAEVSDFSEWRTLEDYPHYYFHPSGVVMSAHQKLIQMQVMMKPKPSLILINSENEKGMVQIARLIAKAFIPNELGYTEVKHLDGNIENVAASNLAWDETSPTTIRNLKEELKDSEMWKPVLTYSGYFISRQGELVSTLMKHYVIMKPKEDKARTCYRISDTTNKTHPTISIQKLLGLAFIPNPENKPHVAPLNGDMLDCDLDNLYWHDNPNGCSEEGWVEVKGFPKYEVSGFGVRNKRTRMMLNPLYPKGGDYPSIGIKNVDSVKKTKYIHLVIARNLIPNPHEYPIVNHKDGNHHNYNINNLEWCTATQNNQHSHDMGLRDGSTSVTMIPNGSEMWKTIAECPSYEVSNTGIVKRGNKIRKLRNLLGYHSISLTHSPGIRTYPLVHRLVAFTFLQHDHLGQPLDTETVYEVNHKNRIRSDNRVENLEIISVKHHREKDQGKAVVAVEPSKFEIVEFKSMTLASQQMNCSVATISKAVRDCEPRDGWYFFVATDPELEAKIELLME